MHRGGTDPLLKSVYVRGPYVFTFRFEKCARRTLVVSVPTSAARPSSGLGRALTAQGSRSLPSTPRAVLGQSLGVRTLRCGLYGVLLYFVSFFGPGG